MTSSDVLGALLEMDPVDFEELVARQFQSLGFQVATTARTGDGGIDVEAVNPDPIPVAGSLYRSSGTSPQSTRAQCATCAGLSPTTGPRKASLSQHRGSGQTHVPSQPTNPSPF